MKKLLLTALAALAGTGALMAEGYQVNTLSARQLGMGATGTALKLGSESMYFNPAGMAWLDKTVDISASFAANMPEARAKVDGTTYKTDNKVSTPMLLSAGFSVYRNLKVGVAFYTPYGSSIDWGANWPGAVLSQNVDLKVYNIQPTVSWAITDRLSVGAGLNVAWGSVNLNKGLIPASTFDAMLHAQGIDDHASGITPVSVALKGTTKVVCGVNLGAMFTLNKHLTFGASFRTKMNMQVESGEARVDFARQAAEAMLSQTLLPISEARFTAEMPAPWVLSLGAAYKPIDRLTLAVDARMTGWKAYKNLDIEFDKAQQFDQHIPKGYKNSWAFSVGAQYALTPRLDLRAGMMVDTTPVNLDNYNPETPGMTKLEPTVGFSFRPVSSLSIDFGFMYVAGMGKDNASCTYTDMLTQRQSTFTADYNLHAFVPSLGVSFTY